MRVKCLAQEQGPGRARTRTSRSRVKPTTHDATAPPFNQGYHGTN